VNLGKSIAEGGSRGAVGMRSGEDTTHKGTIDLRGDPIGRLMSRKAAKKPAKNAVTRAGSGQRLYTLEVFIISGPMTGRFARKNPVIARTIRIRGDQTLEELHHAIFDAFNREEEHMYEFQVGGKGPMDRHARRYVLPGALAEPLSDRKPAGDLTRTTIGSLGVKVDDAFSYWFDFGDDWWHQINVLAIEDAAPRGRYPKVTKRVGESPPQYPNGDEEEAG
jgi:hypothetical protein